MKFKSRQRIKETKDLNRSEMKYKGEKKVIMD